MGEFIARAEFSKEDKKNLKLWSIKDFKSTPKTSVAFYKSINSDVLPNIVAKTTRATYHTELYGNIRKIFHKKRDNSPHNFLAIIEKYNPPIKELYLMRKRNFELQQQMFFSNQRNFNMMMNTQQQSSNIVINSIKDHALHQAVTIEGGTVLQEFNDSFSVKGADEKKYHIGK